MSEMFPSNSPATGKLFFGGCDCREVISTTPFSMVYYGYERNDASEDEKFRRPVVVKVISLDEKLGRIAQERVERYRNELASLHLLNNPHIVKLLSVKHDKDKKQSVFIMECIEGPTVEKAYYEHDLSLAVIARMAQQMCFALTDIHNQGVIHGDIHGGNIMFYKPFNPRTPLEQIYFSLLDFGLSDVHHDDDISKSHKTRRHDVIGLARLLDMILTRQFINRPERTDVRLPALMDVLIVAQLEDGPYDTIPKFESAFKAAMEYRRMAPSLQGFFGFFKERSENPTQIIERPRIRPNAIAAGTQTAETPHIIAEELATQTSAVSIVTDTAPQPTASTVQRKRSKIGLWWMSVAVLLSLFGMLGFIGLEFDTPILSVPAPSVGVVFSALSGRLALIERSTGQILHVFGNIPARVVAVSPDGRYLAADNKVIDLQSGRTMHVFDHQPMPVALAFSVDGAILALHDGVFVQLLDVYTGKQLHVLAGIAPAELDTLFTPAGYHRLHNALTESRRQIGQVATR